jgi:hypothetical protein
MLAPANGERSLVDAASTGHAGAEFAFFLATRCHMDMRGVQDLDEPGWMAAAADDDDDEADGMVGVTTEDEADDEDEFGEDDTEEDDD